MLNKWLPQSKKIVLEGREENIYDHRAENQRNINSEE